MCVVRNPVIEELERSVGIMREVLAARGVCPSCGGPTRPRGRVFASEEGPRDPFDEDGEAPACSCGGSPPARTTRRCGVCGTENPRDETHCAECGVSLSAKTA